MGVVYCIGCKRCKVYRDIDKFPFGRAKTYEDILENQEYLERYKFNVAMLGTFMAEHSGSLHELVLYDDLMDDCLEQVFGLVEEKGKNFTPTEGDK